MTSARKIAANRLNSRKSCGPRSAAGKAIASRNALRHGLSAIIHHQPVSTTDMETFAIALCGNDEGPSLFAQATVIARNALVLRAISEQKLAVVERLREPTAIALARGDNSIELAEARLRKRDEDFNKCAAFRDKLLEKYKDELPPPDEDELTMCEMDLLIPGRLEEFLEEKEREPASGAQDPGAAKADKIDGGTGERDEAATLEEAARDLIRLDRYERRAWSRQRRAIREFTNLKLMLRLDREAAESASQIATPQSSAPAPDHVPAG